jgi:hypothetical protein
MASRDQTPTSLALGIERIGLVPLRWPLAVAIVAVLLIVGAGFGVARLKVDDSLSQLFRSDTEEFRLFEEVSQRFPSTEFDVLVVVEGDVLARDSLQAFRDLATDLHLVDGVKGMVSLFSARSPPEDGHLPEPLFPEVLPDQGPAYDALVERVQSNEIIRGKLLSLDGSLALIVLALDPEVSGSGRLRSVIGEMRDVLQFDLETAGLSGRLSGVPVMQLEIRNAVERDRVVYNAIGFVAGCLIAVFFFRRLSFMLIAAAPPLIAILWALGFLGWLDFRLNMFLNVMTPLIMVISFSDSMQMTFVARDRLLAGDSKYAAMRYATLVVGPAAVVTSATTALSFLTLYFFSDSHLIRTFGAAGAISCVVALVAVLTLVPLFGLLLVRNEASFVASVKGADAAIDALRRACGRIAEVMIRRPALYSVAALAVVGGLTVVYTGLDPRYQLADQVPNRDESVAASKSIDIKLAGANPIDILVDLPEGVTMYDPEALAAIAAVHGFVEDQPGVANVWSVETLHRWLAEKAGRPDVAALRQYVDLLPELLTQRFVSPDRDAVVIAGRIPDIDASQLLPVVEQLDKSLDAVRAAHPGYRIAVTGLSAIAARNSARMIGQLTLGLTVAVPLAAVLIGLAFRSVLVLLASLLPALFPIVISGAVLWLLGEGLQFASVVALIVAFGIGTDATIHYLNRLRPEMNGPAEDAVRLASVHVGPALILTSLVLACGLAVTVISDLPSLRLFGWLSAFTLIAALAGTLLILPSVVVLLRKLGNAMGLGGRGRVADHP